MNDELAARVRQEFGEDADRALAMLATYGDESWHREVDRVQRDIVALSGGDIERLRSTVDAARRDYRDVIYWAEYLPDPDAPRSYEELRRRLGPLGDV